MQRGQALAKLLPQTKCVRSHRDGGRACRRGVGGQVRATLTSKVGEAATVGWGWPRHVIRREKRARTTRPSLAHRWPLTWPSLSFPSGWEAVNNEI
jgi:hypothetical protein